MARMTATIRPRALVWLALGVLALLISGQPLPPSGAAAADPPGEHRCKPTPRQVTLSVSQVTAGGSLVGTVRTSCRRDRPTTVGLAAFPGVTVPGVVTVPAGQRTSRFVVTTAEPGAVTAGLITASRRGRTATARLGVRTAAVDLDDEPGTDVGPVSGSGPGGNPGSNPADDPGQGSEGDPCSPVLTGLAIPPHLYTGDHGIGTVTLSCAPASPVSVGFWQSDHDLSHPIQATVPGGASSASFPLEVLDFGYDTHPSVLSAHLEDVTIDALVIVEPGLGWAYAPVSDVYWNEQRLLHVSISGKAPLGGTTVSVASSHPDVIPPTEVTVPAGSRWIDAPLTVLEPTRTTDVTLTVSLGTSSRTATTEVSLVPVITGGLKVKQDYPAGPHHSRDKHMSLRVIMDSQPAPARGLKVELTSDHPEVFPPRGETIWPGEYGAIVHWDAGPVTGPSLVTITATLPAYPNVTGALQVLVRPGVDLVDAPSTVVVGAPFTATVQMQGAAEIDQEVQFDTGLLDCSPSAAVLAAGETSVSATCVAKPVPWDLLVSMNILLDDDFNYSRTFEVRRAPPR